jgi:prevent-host-death family protein
MATRNVVTATDFKAHCLRLLDEVNETGEALHITKRGKVVAKLVPSRDALGSTRGTWKGRGAILGDIVDTSGGEVWEANR